MSLSAMHPHRLVLEINPAGLRFGYIVAGWDILSRILALKTDAGSGALEQHRCC